MSRSDQPVRVPLCAATMWLTPTHSPVSGGPSRIARCAPVFQAQHLRESPDERGNCDSTGEGRLSTLKRAFMVEFLPSMAKNLSERRELLRGTLDMLILRTLLFGPAHGHQIAKHIQGTTDEVLRIEHGSLYPALHRLERKGWVISSWEAAKDRNRQFKYYRLTPAGKRQLAVERSNWKQLARAIARVMSPA
jgi:PadR family transcriptional regulator PadR